MAQVDAEYGFEDVAVDHARVAERRRAVCELEARREAPGWARYYRLARDRAALGGRRTRAPGRHAAQIAARRGRAASPRYSSDIPDQVLGLHSQAVLWRGWRRSRRVWDRDRQPGRRCGSEQPRLAARLERALRPRGRALAARLLRRLAVRPGAPPRRRAPYGSLMESRAGSYWNLVMPYALASGLFPPGGPQATGIRRYLELHGASHRRCCARARTPSPRPGLPDVGNGSRLQRQRPRFLADNGRADQARARPLRRASGRDGARHLRLRRGGEHRAARPSGRAARCTCRRTAPATRRSGSAASVARARGARPQRACRAISSSPSTPREWLRPGKRIAVHNRADSFGPLSWRARVRRRPR